MKPARFYFINKDAKSGSLSHSDKPERVKIHSHVQLGKKIERSQSPEDKKESSVQTSKPLSKPHIYKWKSGQRAPTRGKRNKSELSKDSPTSSSSGTVNVSDRAYGEGFEYPSLAESLTMKVPYGGSPVDPFETSVIKVDPEVQRLLLYYLHHAHPNTYYTEARFNKESRTVIHNDAQAIVKSCFDDEANMYTLLASMASRMRYLERYDQQKDSSPLISKAIAAIQKRIRENAPITQRMLFNLFLLGTAEFYRWDVAASLVHLRAVGVLVRHLGNFKNIHHSLAEMIILGDGYIAAELGEKPVFSPTELDDDSEALTPQEGIEIMKKLLDGSRHIACGLLGPEQRDIVPSELRWIIMDMAVCLGVLQEHTSESGTNDAPANILHWLHLRNLAVRHRLMALELEDKRSQALRTALLIWDLVLFTVAGRKRSAKVVAARLRDCLTSIPVDDWEDHEQVYLWILTVGAMSAADDSELQSWYIEEISKALGIVEDVLNIAITSLKEFAALEAKFLYNESVQQGAFLGLWNKLTLVTVRT